MNGLTRWTVDLASRLTNRYTEGWSSVATQVVCYNPDAGNHAWYLENHVLLHIFIFIILYSDLDIYYSIKILYVIDIILLCPSGRSFLKFFLYQKDFFFSIIN